MQKHLKPEKSLERQGEVRLSPVEKITAFIGGVLISPLLITVFLKIIPNFWGGFIGTVLALAAGLYILKAYKKPLLKTIALGVIVSTGLVAVGTFIAWIFIMVAFQGLTG